MTVTDTYTEASNKWFELVNDAYHTYVKTLLWGQERVLELTKTASGQASEYQGQAKELTEEYKKEWERVQKLTQSAWQDLLKNTSEIVNQYRATTNANLADLNERINELQTKIESAVKATAK